MKRVLVIALSLFASAAFAQSVCDVTYTTEVETTAGQNVGSTSATLYAIPMADVLDNSAKAKKVLDVLSKQQDKNGPYNLETGEVRSCDGKPPERVAATSVLLKGITLKGTNLGNREALKQADLIAKRFEDRAAKGDKEGWDHNKAAKVKRNDLGQKVK